MLRKASTYGKAVFAAGLAVLVTGCGMYFENGEEQVPQVFELPAQTEVRVVIEATPALSELEVGQSFAGVLAAPLYYRPESIDEEGRTFERAEHLVAVQGAPVYGEVVEAKDAVSGEAVPAVRLTAITFHGGKSFEVMTAAVPVADVDPDTRKTAFKLEAPADVALVIEQRKMEYKKRSASD